MGRNRAQGAPKKRRTGGKVAGLAQLSNSSLEFRRKMLRAGVDKDTAAHYNGHVKKIAKYSRNGELGYATAMIYLEKEKDHSAITKRQALSSMYFEMQVKGEPMPQEDAEDLGFVVDGMEVVEGPRPKRGAMTDKQFGELLKEAKARGPAWKEDLEALEVQFGLCCRGPSVMPELKVRDVVLNRKYVLVPRKGSVLTKCRHGEQQALPIYTQEAYKILAARCKGRDPDAKVFPRWEAARISTLVVETANSRGWTDERGSEIKFDGSHCNRHTAAMATLEECLDAVRERGGWSQHKDAAWYSRLHR